MERIPQVALRLPNECVFYMLPHHSVRNEFSETTKLSVGYGVSMKMPTGILLNEITDYRLNAVTYETAPAAFLLQSGICINVR